MKQSACKTDLGPLTRKLLEQQQEIERLRSERDEARRELCKSHAHGVLSAEDLAMFIGWDCFPQEDAP
jgi:hypothetical protein